MSRQKTSVGTGKGRRSGRTTPKIVIPRRGGRNRGRGNRYRPRRRDMVAAFYENKLFNQSGKLFENIYITIYMEKNSLKN